MHFTIADGTIIQADKRDAKIIAARRWRLGANGYICAYTSRYDPGRRGPVGVTVSLARTIMGCQPGDGMEVDHRNGDPLDNRRRNLRIVTHAQNGQNMAAHRDSTSRHRGVSWSAERGRWRVTVWANGRQHSGGSYDDEEEAAAAARALRDRLMTHHVSERH